MGVIAMLFLPNRPESTTYLTARERNVAIERMNRATSGDIGARINRGAPFPFEAFLFRGEYISNLALHGFRSTRHPGLNGLAGTLDSTFPSTLTNLTLRNDTLRYTSAEHSTLA